MSNVEYFTQTSDAPYNRHHYTVVTKDGKVYEFTSWEEANAFWFQRVQLNQLSHIDVIDIKPHKTKAKGFS